jgi:hypothetical protein
MSHSTNASNEIRLNTVVSLSEAANLIKTCGTEVTFMVQGPMGSGKSSMLGTIAKDLPDHRPVYMDATTLDLGDVSGVPKVCEVNGVEVTKFAPNAMLGLHSKTPVILMVDEFGKAMRPVQNTFLRLLLERKLGEEALPDGSIIFATTNMMAEGLGDMVQPHARNRISVVTTRSPDADEWCEWAMNNDVEAEVIAWVNQNPQCLASYTDPSQSDNVYIYHPSKPAGAFVTPRSLTKASRIIKHRGVLGYNATMAGVAGCLGESAARDMMAFADLADKLPTWESIIRTPEKAKLPTAGDAASNFITIYSAITRIERDTLDNFLTYLQRMPREFQAVFAINVIKSSKRSVVMASSKFAAWTAANAFMF